MQTDPFRRTMPMRLMRPIFVQIYVRRLEAITDSNSLKIKGSGNALGEARSKVVVASSPLEVRNSVRS